MLKNNFHNSGYVMAFAAFIAFFLSACGERHTRDLREYVDELQAKAVASENRNIPTSIPGPPVVTYNSEKLRSPFQDIVVTPAKGTPSNPITGYSLKLLHLVGILKKNDKDWAVIQVPDGKIYLLTIGDVIGDHYDKISKIAIDHVEVQQAIQDESGTTQKTVILQLKDQNQ